MGSSKRFLAVAGVAWFSFAASVRAQQPAPAVAAAGAPATPAVPPTRQQCLDAHEQAQSARLSGQLMAARRALRECSAAACPALVSRDCVGWLADVEQQIPSVIFRAVKDGTDLEALRIHEGERLLTESLTGTPLELDPGPHHFSAELEGFPPQQATYVLQAGDKARVVRFDFVTPAPAAPAPGAASTPPASPPPPDEAPAPRPVPTLSYVLGGTALGALVAGAVLGGLALGERHDVEQRCAPLCETGDLRAVKGLALAADISLAVAVLSAGGAVYSYVTRPSVPRPAPVGVSRLGLSAGSGEWRVVAGGSF